MSFVALLICSVFAQASFDANNVRVGDPMILTVDCIGAEFTEVHPPAISKEVDAKIWKVDDESAKTETFNNGRRFVYRVRPIQEGLQTFPALSFLEAETQPIPVHVKPGVQAVLAGLEQDLEGFPMPDGILIRLAKPVSDDVQFKWLKACRTLTAEAFAPFDFPEARLNEAACHILEGNWAKAIQIYSRLEWRTGQTPILERGIVAALARKHNSAVVELPVWRVTFRPILQYAWQGRLLFVLGSLLAFVLVGWCVSRLMRVFVCVTVICLAATLSANEIKATLSLSRPAPQVGEAFEFIVSLERPKGVTLEGLQYQATEAIGLTVLGQVQNLPDLASSNPSNVITRQSIPVRYDVPFQGNFSLLVSAMATIRQTQSGHGFSFVTQSSQAFQVPTKPIRLAIQPLPSANQPPDFKGAVGTDFKIAQHVVNSRVETNDVVKIIYKPTYKGYLPPEAFAAYAYFIADGATRTPDISLVYYDTGKKDYVRVMAKGCPLRYYTAQQEEAESVAMDAVDTNVLRLRFAPTQSAPLVATVPKAATPVLETNGVWARVALDGHAGWVLQEELK